MMTPDDCTNHGSTSPDRFPARREIIRFCELLREERDISKIRLLPAMTGGEYDVILHKPEMFISSSNREFYFRDIADYRQHFRDIADYRQQVVFLDPDNGMEPEKRFNEKHVRYIELKAIIDQISEASVVSVFQHFRRKRFFDDFNRIKERVLEVVPSVHMTAVHWHQLMFVILGKSEEVIEAVRRANEDYKSKYPVELII